MAASMFAAFRSWYEVYFFAVRQLSNRRAGVICRQPTKVYSLENYFSTVAKGSLSVELSESCVKRLKAITSKDEKYLRIIVDGGGCSGFQYIFQLDNKIHDDDCLVEREGVGVVIDKTSLEYMKGATVDYGDELIRSSFRVINNPKAEKGCSCGASFNVKGL